jgi:pyruvate/2-oxoglutarate dehydrogenase complex dihydrolipoamide acyltransferase (E2) component
MSRLFSSAVRKSIRLLPMPKLSPSMISGIIKKWHIRPGASTKSYQLVVEISTNTLTKLGNNKIEVMDVEIIEDTFLAQILVQEGEPVNVGGPIAVFCEESSEMEEACKLQVVFSFTNCSC